MTEPYLILHKVRGEPAFDVAERLFEYTEVNEAKGVVSMDVIWIIPTSGHRAYPWWSIPLSEISWGHDEMELSYSGFTYKDIMSDAPLLCPPDIPDHYACNEAPKPKPPARVVATTDDFLV